MDDSHLGTHAYSKDLATELRRVDKLIFQSRGWPGAIIRSAESLPDDLGYYVVRIQNFAGFYSPLLSSNHRGDNVRRLPRKKDEYTIWQRGVDRKVRSVFLEGFGDAKLRSVWFATAVALVRARVLCRSMWFPECRETTLKTLRRFAGYFGPTVFVDLPRLQKRFDAEYLSATEIDVRLTVLIVLTLIKEGRSEEDALRLIITG